MTEIWKENAACPGYLISNHGRIKRVVYKNKCRPHRILKQQIQMGYPVIRIKPKTFRMHYLVISAFIGPREDGFQVNHKDGNKLNNHISNLEYVTASENVKHSYRELGRIPMRGALVYTNKLSEKDVKEIRKYSKNIPHAAIAEKYKVTRGAIKNIRTGKSWRWL